ncbi:Carboxylesterase type B [Macrophomina phaseolina MS6]|uniref:Carboxylic ester hydrolase n=1 Tax=Macrophomina phaseolina (strain MS6) TaxID=1126212 RepID=K2RXS2_MACPH|nr:Carboxylesterase type B [Macrophomina phaseolina MS6]
MPIIGASLNYRVGPFGFLQSKDIRATGATNLGLRDVYLGLEWMQENIAAFGGDPSKVTIWGESAGAGVVGHMTTAFGDSREGLFRGAIAQSGGPLMFFPPSESLQESTYKGYLKGTGCDHAQDRIDCLRDVPWETIQNLTGNIVGQFNPTVDGDIVPERSSLLLAQGNFTKIPLLIGANTADGAAFAPQGINNDTSLYNYLRNLGLDDRTVENLLLLYPDIPGYGAPPTYVGRPNSTIGVQYQRAGQLINDFYYHRGRRYTAQYWSKYKVPVYTYHFGVWPLPGLSELQGTTHYFETPFVFYNLDGAGLDPQNAISSFPQVYTDLAKLMCRSWISFVHDLNPNKRPQSSSEAEALTPKWPIYAPNGELALEGYGENFHFDLNVTGAAYIERDIYRSPGIAYWFSNEVQKQIGS